LTALVRDDYDRPLLISLCSLGGAHGSTAITALVLGSALMFLLLYSPPAP
jgi:hypothetical protein